MSKMPKSSPGRKLRRGPRVKLAGSVLCLICLENGRQVRARVHQVSITGGLLQLAQPMDEGIKVEVLFHVGSSTLRTQIRMLFPMWATQGYLQPFEFVDMAEDERLHLQHELQKFLSDSPAILATSPIGAKTPSETNQ